jgi:hypothetical protein
MRDVGDVPVAMMVSCIAGLNKSIMGSMIAADSFFPLTNNHE